MGVWKEQSRPCSYFGALSVRTPTLLERCFRIVRLQVEGLKDAAHTVMDAVGRVPYSLVGGIDVSANVKLLSSHKTGVHTHSLENCCDVGGAPSGDECNLGWMAASMLGEMQKQYDCEGALQPCACSLWPRRSGLARSPIPGSRMAAYCKRKRYHRLTFNF